MSDELKNIKITLDYSDENGKRSTKEQTIKINTLILKDKMPIYLKPKNVYTLSFSLKLPDHIHKFVIGKTIPRSEMGRNSETFTYREDFPKTITSSTIEGLTQRWYDVITDYEWLKSIDVLELKKVIFYNFDHADNDEWKSSYNSVAFGVKANVGYTMAIGYISETAKGINRYNKDKKLLSNSNHREIYAMEYVTWTESREQFFNNIYLGLTGLIQKILEFSIDLTEDKVDELMNKKQNLLN